MSRKYGPPIEAVVTAITRRTAEIVGALRSADLGAPSELPGWTRLTIACHLRYGAEAFARLTEATLAGSCASYYPHGRDHDRPRTLEPREGEQPADVVASLASASAHLADVWARVTDWDRILQEPPDRADLGPVPLRRLALLRLTEVEVHGLDLGIGLAPWSEVFVAEALPQRLMWLETRRTNHRPFDTGLQGSWLLDATDGEAYRVSVSESHVSVRPGRRRADAVIRASSHDLLALLLGRPVNGPVDYSGDETLGRAWSRAFPGP